MVDPNGFPVGRDFNIGALLRREVYGEREAGAACVARYFPANRARLCRAA